MSIRIIAHDFGEKEAWAYPGTAQIFWVPSIMSGMGKATDFKFGQYIQRVHPNKSPLKILEKRERGRIQGLPNFFRVPPIISGTGQASHFKFGEGSADVIQRSKAVKTVVFGDTKHCSLGYVRSSTD